jgi:hypothetical protein
MLKAIGTTQVVDISHAERAARVAYADALAHGRSYHEARHAYAATLREHAAIHRKTKRPR